MGFEDVAKSMKERHGRAPKGGVIDLGADPEATISQIKRADRRGAAIKNFIQAAILILFGGLMNLYSVRGGGYSLWGVGAIVVGVVRITQGIALLREPKPS